MSDRWLYAWALGSLSFGAASLLVPVYIVQLGAGPVQLGILAASAAIVGAPGALLYGRLANEVERQRPLVLSSLLLVTVVLAIFPMLERITWIIIVNAGLWFIIASVGPVLTMVVVDAYPPSAWSQRLGQFNKFQGYGWATGLVLGTAWPSIGVLFGGPVAVTRSLFWILTGGAALSFLWAMRTLPRTRTDPSGTTRESARRITNLLSTSNRGIRGNTFAFTPTRLYWATKGLRPSRLRQHLDSALTVYLLAVGLAFTGFAAFWAPLPLFLLEEGFDASQIFGLYVVSSLASAGLYGRVGSWGTKYDGILLFSWGLALRGLLFPFIASVFLIGTTWIGFGVAGVLLAAIGVTWAVIAVIGTTIATTLAPARIRGDVLGLHTALVAVAGGIGGLLGGWLASIGYVVAVTVPGALVLLAAGLAVTLRQSDTSTDVESGTVSR